MILWVDAHISPKLCPWIRRQFVVDAVHVRDLGLRGAEDPEIFDRGREARVVVFTKDEDFVDLVGPDRGHEGVRPSERCRVLAAAGERHGVQLASDLPTEWYVQPWA